MKTTFKITSVLFLFLAFFACDIQNNTENEPLDLNDMDLNLEIDFSKGKFPIDKGMDILASEIASYIYSDELNADEKITEFKIRKSNNELLINYELAETSGNIASSIEVPGSYEPCETKKKTCRSESCVTKVLKEILGDGTRDVDIKYRRHTFSVTIEYTYQDC